ncbi:MAG: tyrosine-type recombinase/integrase [Ferruginibacter sp.]
MLTMRTYLRSKRLNKKGEAVLNFIVSPGDHWITTGISIAPGYWDACTETISKKHPDYYAVNPLYQLYKSRAEQCINILKMDGVAFNKQYFQEFIFKGGELANNPHFFDVLEEYANNSNLSWARVKHYQELKKDIAAIRQKPFLKDINFQFIAKLRSYLATKKPKANNSNTITRKIKQIKAIIHYAQNTGLLQTDPLTMVKLKEIKGAKKHLTAAELKILETLYSGELQPSHKTTLGYFLFSCYTGLRYSDIIALDHRHIIKGCVTTVQEKTDKPVMVPLIEKAKALLQVQQIGLCFKIFSNQFTNRMLKDIMKLAGIDKKITYHCSRHTFGTLSIYWGIPKEVVADLMGVDFKTVAIYAQIVDEVKAREMLKWEAAAG